MNLRIKELRISKGLSIRKLVELLDMHKTTYARYEIGEQKLSLEVAIKLADFYRVSLDYLVGRSDENLWKAQK